MGVRLGCVGARSGYLNRFGRRAIVVADGVGALTKSAEEVAARRRKVIPVWLGQLSPFGSMPRGFPGRGSSSKRGP
jgi:hypothetical protein